jgi:hypothetical protein
MRVFIFRFLFLLTFVHGVSFAYIDTDFDGVSDQRDECPNTPFSALVDARGCTVKKVHLAQEVAKLSVVIGASYSTYKTPTNKTKTLSQSLELDYEIQKIKLQLYVSHFNAKNSVYSQFNDAAFGDTRLSLTYTLDTFIPNFRIYLGGGLIIPNYEGAMDNNNIDISSSINMNYYIGKLSLFGGYTYTMVGDSDLSYLSYQNTNALSLGVGYSFSPKIYSSLSWFWSEASVKSADSMQNLSWFTYMNLNQKMYGTFSLTQDLNDEVVSHSYGMQLGYRL